MLTFPLAALSVLPAASGAAASENGAKPDETGDSFAALLNAQGVAAASEPVSDAAAPRSTLPKGGKILPEPTEGEPGTLDPTASAPVEPGDAPSQPDLRVELLTLPFVLPTVTVHGEAPPSKPEVKPAVHPTARLIEAVALPIQAKAPAKAVPDELPTASATALAAATETPPGPGSVTRKVQALPAQAAARAVLGQGDTPSSLPPVLPDQAAPRATVALAARGNPERPAKTDPIVAQPISAEPGETEHTPAALPPRPLAQLAALAAPAADMQPAAAASPDSNAAPVVAAPALARPDSARPDSGRPDFAAVVDRLIEARDAAIVRPVAMTLRHQEFGPVSVQFRSGEDGLTVTMASLDPDFARAVNAAAAPASASNHRDTPRQSGDPAPSRQHGGGMADDQSAQSRGGSRFAERTVSRERDEASQAHRETPRQRGRGGIFA